MVCFDTEYISSVEYTWTKALGNNAEFEYICDKNYFWHYLNVPRDIDILLIEKDYYLEAISRQNCKNVYILTEDEMENIKIGNVNVKALFKYASVRVILDILKTDSPKNSMTDGQLKTKLLSVYAINGGCGKTTTAIGVAAQLAKSGHKVLYFNSDCFQDHGYIVKTETTLADDVACHCVMDCENATKMILQNVEKNVFEYVPPFSKPLAAYQITFEATKRIMNCLLSRNLYDYLVLELPQELDGERLEVLQKSDRVLLVTTQSKHASERLKIFMEGLTEIHGQIVIACNRYHKERQNYLQESAEQWKDEIAEYIEEQEAEVTLTQIAEKNLFVKTAVAIR